MCGEPRILRVGRTCPGGKRCVPGHSNVAIPRRTTLARDVLVEQRMRILPVITALLAGCAMDPAPGPAIPGQLNDGMYTLEWHLAGRQPTTLEAPALVEAKAFELTPDALVMLDPMTVTQRDHDCAYVAAESPRSAFQMCVIDTANNVIGTIPWRFDDGSWQTWWFVARPMQ
jgi:hypothetical protein